MRQYKVKRFAWMIVVLTIIVFAAFFFISGHNSNPSVINIYGDIGKTVTVVALFAVAFEKWIWRFPLFMKLLVPFPCLDGLWEGTFKYRLKEDGEVLEKTLQLQIRQTFLHLSVEAKTDESSSTSLCASFNIEDAKGVRQLIYSYMNIPKQEFREHSAIHFGTTLLDVSQDGKTMEGYYWTDRKTRGDITLKKTTDR